MLYEVITRQLNNKVVIQMETNTPQQTVSSNHDRVVKLSKQGNRLFKEKRYREALRWVMGESSYKAMRASGMDDVIFRITSYNVCYTKLLRSASR